MRYYLVLFIISILFSSCATLLNQPYVNVEIKTTEPSEVIHNKDTVKTVNNKTNLWVERKNEKLSFEAITDSISKTIEVKNSLSSAFWCGNLFSGVGIFGYLIDLKSPKRYTYPKRVYINSAETDGKYYRYNPITNRKGELYLHLSLPYINSFYIEPPSESYKGSIGFFGISAGVDYYHSQSQFINVSASGVMDFFFPIPAPFDLSGEHKLSNSLYFSLQTIIKSNAFRLDTDFHTEETPGSLYTMTDLTHLHQLVSRQQGNTTL